MWHLEALSDGCYHMYTVPTQDSTGDHEEEWRLSPADLVRTHNSGVLLKDPWDRLTVWLNRNGQRF